MLPLKNWRKLEKNKMFAYFRYLSKVIFTKVPLWCVVGISYLFTFIFIILIPLIIKVSPLSIWNFDIVNIQATFIIIDAVKSSLLVVYAFRNDIEDGTELIIYSKPLRRTKILISKFIWILLGGLVISMGYVIIALFTYCFGQYDPINNVGGIEFSKVPSLIGSLIIGPFIVNLLFGGIGILISKFGSKLQIVISVTMISIAISVYDIVGSAVLNSIQDNIEAKYGGKINSFSSKTSNSKFENYAYYNTQPGTDLYYAYKENQDIGNTTYQYLNICKQLSSFYKLFNVDDIDNILETTPFGSSANYTFKISSPENVLLKDFVNNYENFNLNSYPLLMPFKNSIYSQNESNNPSNDSFGFIFLGLNSSLLTYLKYIGASSHTVWVSNLTTLFAFVPTTYIIDDELLKTGNASLSEFDADIYKNITFEVLSNEEYNTIRNTDDKAKSQATQTKFTEMCYNFIKNNAEKYGFDISNLTSINCAFAKLQYSMIRQFSLIYWSQIIGQICNNLGVSVIDYFTNTDDKFNESFNYKINITDPYNSSETASDVNDVNLNTVLRCFLAYTGAGQLTNTPTSITNTRFAYSNYGMDLNGLPLFDNTKNYYFMFPHTFIKIYNELGFDITTIYNYQTAQYYTKLQTSLFWSIISFILFGISMYYYLRSDIY